MRACPRCGGYVHLPRWRDVEPYCLMCGWRDNGPLQLEARPVRVSRTRARKSPALRSTRLRAPQSGRRSKDWSADIQDRPYQAGFCKPCAAARKRTSNAQCDARRRPPRRALTGCCAGAWWRS